MKRVASVDIGSNTTLLLIVENSKDGLEVLSDKIYFTRLMEGMQTEQVLSIKSLERLDVAFSSISKSLKKYNIKEVSIVATSASRNAKNKEDLFALGRKHGLTSIEVISPKREAELTFLGSLFALGHELSKPLVIDIGGGSTELASNKVSYSLDMGSVSLTERFLTMQAPSETERFSLSQFVCQQLQVVEDFFKKDFDGIVFVAGTPICLAFMEYQTSDPNDIHGKVMSMDQVNFWLNHLSGLSVAERKKEKHLPEHRSDVIISGLTLLKEILQITGQKEFIVSATGVRYGLALEQIQK